MTEQQIFEKIAPDIAEKLGFDTVTMDDWLSFDLGADSLDMVEMCMDVERRFEISFLPDGNKKNFDIENAYISENITSVGNLVKLIKRKLDEKESSAMVLFFMTRGGKKLPRKTPRKPADKFVMPQKPMMFNPGNKR